MKSYNKLALLAGMPAIATLSVASLPAFADSVSFMEEVLVTAQKREQDISTVPIAVSAFSGEQLEANNLSRTEDLEIVTPGLMVDYAGLAGAATTFTIRGVAQSNFEDHNEGPIAIYQDGAYFSMLGGLNFTMFDIERVEVLRGPQGTLFGRNATGGLVHVLSKQPTEDFEGYFKGSYGSYDTWGLEGAVGGALADSVRGRLSVQYNQTDGFLDNNIAGQLDDFGNRINGDDGGDGDSLSLRGQLVFDLSDSATLALRATYTDAESTPGGYQHVPSFVDPANDFLGTPLPANVTNTTSFCTFPFALGPQAPGNSCLGYRDTDGDVHEGAWDTPGKFDLETKGLTAQLDMSIGEMEFVSITDFRNLERAYAEDTDGSPRAGILFSTVQDTDQFSQEFRLSGSTDRIKWVAGIYYLNIDGEYESDLDFGIPFFSPVAQLDGDTDYQLETETWSVFGEVEVNLNDELSLILGARHTDDEKEFDFSMACASLVGLCAPAPFAPFGLNPVFSDTKDEQDYAARVVLNWTPNEDWFLYAGVTRGNKAGGFNAPATADVPDPQLSYDAEVLTNYEAGFKATLWDGRLRLNTSVYHYDYEDYQAFAFKAGKTIVFNTEAEIDGAEIELFVQPFENSNLELMLGVSLMDAEVDDITLPSGRIADGQEMTNAPDVTYSGVLSNSWELAGGVVRANLNFNYVDERQTNVQNHPVDRLDSYTVVNARVSYTTAGDSWEFSALIRNLGDEEYATYALDASDTFGYTLVQFGAPRTVGVEAAYRF